jgi:hypothetical protein
MAGASLIKFDVMQSINSCKTRYRVGVHMPPELQVAALVGFLSFIGAIGGSYFAFLIGRETFGQPTDGQLKLPGFCRVKSPTG